MPPHGLAALEDVELEEFIRKLHRFEQVQYPPGALSDNAIIAYVRGQVPSGTRGYRFQRLPLDELDRLARVVVDRLGRDVLPPPERIDERLLELAREAGGQLPGKDGS